MGSDFIERLVDGQLLSRMTELEAELAAERAANGRLRDAGGALEFMLGFYIKHFSPVGRAQTVREEALAALDAWDKASRER